MVDRHSTGRARPSDPAGSEPRPSPTSPPRDITPSLAPGAEPDAAWRPLIKYSLDSLVFSVYRGARRISGDRRYPYSSRSTSCAACSQFSVLRTGNSRCVWSDRTLTSRCLPFSSPRDQSVRFMRIASRFSRKNHRLRAGRVNVTKI